MFTVKKIKSKVTKPSVMFRKILYSLICSLTRGIKMYKAPISQPPYWADPRLHMFGNYNSFHANVAPIFTEMLDRFVYNTNLRKHVCEEILSKFLPANNSSILDVGCGSGVSSFSLSTSFNKSNIYAIDTSFEMLKVASSQRSNKNLNYEFGNVHYYSLDNIDMATLMFVLHEVPRDARLSMLKRLSKSVDTVAVLDISQDYSPSRGMLYGEPYLFDYLENINNDMEKSFKCVFKYDIIPKHATLWIGRNDFRHVI